MKAKFHPFQSTNTRRARECVCVFYLHCSLSAIFPFI